MILNEATRSETVQIKQPMVYIRYLQHTSKVRRKLLRPLTVGNNGA